MPSSQYNPLNGREIREAAKLRICKDIDALPYLREGNSFHNVNVQIGILITAYPSDVPVPNLDEEFDIPSKGFNELEAAIDQVEKAEELAQLIEKIDSNLEKLSLMREKTLELRNTLVYESELDPSFNGNVPDQTRIDSGLPVTIEKVEKGKRVEQKIKPMEFQKMVK